MKVPIRLAALTAASVLALAGCGGMGNDPGDDSTEEVPAADPVVEGRWIAEDPEDAFLEFTEVDEHGGTVSGSDGCNGIQGEFHLDGDTAEIERGFGTLKGCPGVDTWLSGVTVVVVDGDSLSVQNDEGEDLGVLTRDDDGDDAVPAPSGSASASLNEAEESDDSDATDDRSDSDDADDSNGSDSSEDSDS